MSEKPVLVVDLDGSLIKTDLFFESFWSTFSEDATTVISTLGSIFLGKAHLKAHLAECVEIDASRLPYNMAVCDIILAWRKDGGRTALVTASDRKVAEAVASHLGLFDEIYSLDGARNLEGQVKGEFLVERLGGRRFDYIGGAHADLSVWKGARRAITVDAPAAIKQAIQGVSTDVQHIETERRNWSIYAKVLRPHQWLKNVLIFLPAMAAHDRSAETWVAALLAFVAFSLVASGMYVLNDLLDLSADRAHPRKSKRPFASGSLPLAHGSLMAPALLIAGFLCALAVGRLEFLGFMVGYILLTTAYSFILKHRLVIDICTLAGLYTMRILAGGAATGIPLSVWLLVFSIFIFLSLAAVKRQAELADGVASGRAKSYGRAYHVEDLPIVSTIAIASGYVAVLVMALYVNTPVVQSLYNHPEFLLGICPVLLYWITRMVMVAHRGGMHDDPIVFAARDRVSQICGLLVAGIVVAGGVM